MVRSWGDVVSLVFGTTSSALLVLYVALLVHYRKHHLWNATWKGLMHLLVLTYCVVRSGLGFYALASNASHDHSFDPWKVATSFGTWSVVGLSLMHVVLLCDMLSIPEKNLHTHRRLAKWASFAMVAACGTMFLEVPLSVGSTMIVSSVAWCTPYYLPAGDPEHAWAVFAPCLDGFVCWGGIGVSALGFYIIALVTFIRYRKKSARSGPRWETIRSRATNGVLFLHGCIAFLATVYTVWPWNTNLLMRELPNWLSFSRAVIDPLLMLCFCFTTMWHMLDKPVAITYQAMVTADEDASLGYAPLSHGHGTTGHADEPWQGDDAEGVPGGHVDKECDLTRYWKDHDALGRYVGTDDSDSDDADDSSYGSTHGGPLAWGEDGTSLPLRRECSVDEEDDGDTNTCGDRMSLLARALKSVLRCRRIVNRQRLMSVVFAVGFGFVVIALIVIVALPLFFQVPDHMRNPKKWMWTTCNVSYVPNNATKCPMTDMAYLHLFSDFAASMKVNTLLPNGTVMRDAHALSMMAFSWDPCYNSSTVMNMYEGVSVGSVVPCGFPLSLTRDLRPDPCQNVLPLSSIFRVPSYGWVLIGFNTTIIDGVMETRDSIWRTSLVTLLGASVLTLIPIVVWTATRCFKRRFCPGCRYWIRSNIPGCGW